MNHERLTGLIRQFFGQASYLTIPVPMIQFMDGEPEGALFLSQLVYWSDKSSLKDGWFYKTYQEWNEEIYLSEYKIKKFARLLVDKGILETKVKKANGSPTVHYRVDMVALFEWITRGAGGDPAPPAQPTEQAPVVVEGGKEIVWNQEARDAFWDAIPTKAFSNKTDKKIFEAVSKWSAHYRTLDSAPDWCKYVSYLLHRHTGFEPSSKAKIWVSACHELWSAAKQNEEILIAGLQEGEKARKDRGLTMSGPRSYMNFCKNQAALVEQGRHSDIQVPRQINEKTGREIVRA